MKHFITSRKSPRADCRRGICSTGAVWAVMVPTVSSHQCDFNASMPHRLIYLLMKSCRLKEREDDTCSAVARSMVEMNSGRSKLQADARHNRFLCSIDFICEEVKRASTRGQCMHGLCIQGRRRTFTFSFLPFICFSPLL